MHWRGLSRVVILDMGQCEGLDCRMTVVEHPRLLMLNIKLDAESGAIGTKMPMEKIKQIPEIQNDTFYVKKLHSDKPCQFAYLHLADEADKCFLAVFESLETDTPKVYWWTKSDLNARRFFSEFIGEAYLSLYIKCGLEKSTDQPLWKTSQAIKSGFPSIWWNVVKEIKR